MKCPNCGNEAINVNGKFVCLDCGIEISPQAQPAGATVPQVGNHVDPTPQTPPAVPIATSADSVTGPEETAHGAREKVIMPSADFKPTASLKDQYLAELEKEEQQGGGSFDFSGSGSAATTPDFLTGSTEPANAAATSTPDFPIVDQSVAAASSPTGLATEVSNSEVPQLAEAPVAVAENPVPVTDFSNIFNNQVANEEPKGVEAPSSLDFNALNNFNPAQVAPEEAVAEPVVPESVEPAPAQEPSINEVSVPEVSAEPEPLAQEVPAPQVPETPTPEVAAVEQSEETSAPVEPTNPFDVQLPPVSNLGDPVEEEKGAQEAPAEAEVEVFNPIPEQLQESTPAPEPAIVPAPQEVVEQAPAQEVVPTLEASPQEPVSEPAPTSTPDGHGPEEIEIPINAVPKPETVAEAVTAEPASYFQPASMDITSHEESPAVQAPESLPQEQPAAAEQPIQMDQPATETAATPQGGGLDLDTLLDKYSAPASSGYQVSAQNGGTVDSVQPAQYSSYDLAKENPVVAPPTNEIPSVASVFEDGYVDPRPAIEEQAKKNSKIKLFIGIGIAVVVLLGALAGFVVYTSTANQGSSVVDAIVKDTQEGVPKKIEEPQSIKATFKETVDFSKLSLKPQITPADGQALLTLFGAPLVNEGSWEANSENDISQNSKLGEASNVRIYSDAAKMTYISNGSGWTKKEGRLIEGIPVFYSAIERGSLFYSSKIEKLSYVKKNTETEVSEFRITPKSDLIKESIISLSPLFAKLNIESIDASGLVIAARVDAEKNLQGVTVVGDVVVKADLFEGTISYNSFADYSYGFTEIEIPQVYQNREMNKIIVQIPYPTKRG